MIDIDTVQAALIVTLILGALAFLVAPSRPRASADRRYDAPALRGPVVPTPRRAAEQTPSFAAGANAEAAGVVVLYSADRPRR